jgi:hypothetical protein
LWEYHLPPSFEKQWDEYFESDACCRIGSPATMHMGGGGDIHSVSIWIWANKAKARRLADRLDRHFETQGDLRKSSVYEEKP